MVWYILKGSNGRTNKCAERMEFHKTLRQYVIIILEREIFYRMKTKSEKDMLRAAGQCAVYYPSVNLMSFRFRQKCILQS
jgi:hypothetical protein